MLRHADHALHLSPKYINSDPFGGSSYQPWGFPKGGTREPNDPGAQCVSASWPLRTSSVWPWADVDCDTPEAVAICKIPRG